MPQFWDPGGSSHSGGISTCSSDTWEFGPQWSPNIQQSCNLLRVPIRRATQKSDSSRFRVSGFVDWNQLSLSVFRVSGFVAWNQLSLSVSGFGFRRLKPGFGFRVSIGPGEVKSSESVSGFGFRSVLGKVKSSEAVSGFGFRSALGTGFGFRVSSIETHFRCRFRVSGFDRPWGS